MLNDVNQEETKSKVCLCFNTKRNPHPCMTGTIGGAPSIVPLVNCPAGPTTLQPRLGDQPLDFAAGSAQTYGCPLLQFSGAGTRPSLQGLGSGSRTRDFGVQGHKRSGTIAVAVSSPAGGLGEVQPLTIARIVKGPVLFASC